VETDCKIKFDPFYKKFVPSLASSSKFDMNSPLNILLSANDKDFDDHLASILKGEHYFYFKQLKELQTNVEQ